jgi:GDPmannose 4,6-dehydratase
MWLMLQADEPRDYVIATGETHTIREFLEIAFGALALSWEDHVEIDARYFRPTEVNLLLGDYTKARELLGWKPRTNFEQLVQLIVDADWERAGEERHSASYSNGSAACDRELSPIIVPAGEERHSS